ncbi:hypothetical protein SEA_KNOCKER_97 [Mycobacterium phage Knocker]|nr:hypothetical protein SEA_KNOCKER_97 [Mycobacterium phage Knocker]
MSQYVQMSVDNNQGYAPDQVNPSTTLADLRDAIEDAIEEFGEDALIVTKDTGNRYGARFGRLDGYGDMFTDPEADNDD